MTVIRTLLTTVLLVGLSACGLTSGEDTVESDDASTALEQQRSDVRAAARALLLGAEKELSATARERSSGFRGCESAFGEQFRSFEYLTQARIDTGPGTDALLLRKLRPVFEEAGFTVDDLPEEPNGFTTLAAAKGDLAGSFVHTGGPFIGLDVSGPCVDVPEDEREAWLRKDGPQPESR
jgi:hypothetical protein